MRILFKLVWTVALAAMFAFLIVFMLTVRMGPVYARGSRGVGGSPSGLIIDWPPSAYFAALVCLLFVAPAAISMWHGWAREGVHMSWTAASLILGIVGLCSLAFVDTETLIAVAKALGLS